jgi:hypothetical protein
MANEIKGPRFTISFVQRKIYKNDGCFSPPLPTYIIQNIKVFIKTNQVYFTKKEKKGHPIFLLSSKKFGVWVQAKLKY